MEQVTGIEPATISLATRSSTAELHLHGAGREIRTLAKSLEGSCATATPYPQTCSPIARILFYAYIHLLASTRPHSAALPLGLFESLPLWYQRFLSHIMQSSPELPHQWCVCSGNLEPEIGVEPTTSSLQKRCSSIELLRHGRCGGTRTHAGLGKN